MRFTDELVRKLIQEEFQKIGVIKVEDFYNETNITYSLTLTTFKKHGQNLLNKLHVKFERATIDGTFSCVAFHFSSDKGFCRRL